MKAKTIKEIEVRAIRIDVPVNYGTEDIPDDFPLRDGDSWGAVVDIDTGKIHNWPNGHTGDMHMKVCDGGTYRLYDESMCEIAKHEGYVPHGVVPGEYGDYIELKIDKNGFITNWPKKPNFEAFGLNGVIGLE